MSSVMTMSSLKMRKNINLLKKRSLVAEVVPLNQERRKMGRMMMRKEEREQVLLPCRSKTKHTLTCWH